MKNYIQIIFLIILFNSPIVLSEPIDRLIAECSMPKYKNIMKRLIHRESSGNVYAININGDIKLDSVRTLKRAKSLLAMLDGSIFSYDVGLTQLNIFHFRKNGFLTKKGFTIHQALDPCLNILMGSLIFDDAVRMSKGDFGAALSIYNTGNKTSGFRNGYVDRVLSDF